MKPKKAIQTLSLLAAAFVASRVPADAPFDLSWFSIDGGGGSSTDGVYTIRGAMGQPDAGRLTGAPIFSLMGGYWGAAGAAPCAADFNDDGFVDDADFVQFAAMYDILECTAPAMLPDCPGDLDGDGYVDDKDFVLFANAYNELLCP
ncbi:MAG: hypothetical protein ACREJD_11890 [Phycisphaerales bacterium]